MAKRYRKFRLLAVTLLFVGSVLSGQVYAKDPDWGPKFATPGITLVLKESARDTAASWQAHAVAGLGGIFTTKPSWKKEGIHSEVIYRLEVSGLPQGKKYSVWFKEFAGSAVELRIEFKSDGSGRFYSEKKKSKLYLDEMTIAALDYSKGEPFEVAVISSDKKIKTFAKAYPIPIEAREGNCRIWMELISPDGNAFVVQGEGFQPEKELTTTSRSDGEVIESKVKVGSDGTFGAGLLPAVEGKKSGTASYTVVSGSCSLTLEYEWGAAAFEKP